MNTEKITEKLYDELDNERPGTVYDWTLHEAGELHGLQHNGVWVRIVKFDRNNCIYAMQSDSYDEEPAIGTLEDVAEYIAMQEDVAEDVKQADEIRRQENEYYRMLGQEASQ